MKCLYLSGMDLSATELLTLFGIFTTLGVSIYSLYLSWKTSRKTLYINSITSSRIKWIDDFRNDVANFAGLVTHYQLTDLNEKERNNLLLEIDRLSYIIELRLNPTLGGDFERKIVSTMNSILEGIENERDELDPLVEELVEAVQILLKYEWEVVKEEASHGPLSKKNRNSVYNGLEEQK